MSIIDDDHRLARILESTNTNKYELIYLPIKQPNDSSHEPKGVRMAPTLDKGSMLILTFSEGSSTRLR